MGSGWKKDYLRYKDFFLNVLNTYNQKPNLKIYLELILSLSTISIFAFFAIKPTILTIIELNKEIGAKITTSTALKQKIKNLKTASDILQQESQNIHFINQAVPKNDDLEVLVKQVENLLTESSLQILGFSSADIIIFGNKADVKKTSDVQKLSDDANELTFSFSASGSYQNILLFLTKIENLRRPIKIDSITINSSFVENGKVIVLIVTGRVPFLLK